MHNKLIFRVVLGLCGIAINAYCETPTISCDGVNRNISGQGAKMTVVDVRGAVDFKKSHIPGAINAPYDTIAKAKLPKDGTFVLYCNNNQCPFSKLAAKTLEGSGYKNLWVLDGGIAEWTAENFALETPAGITQNKQLIPVAGTAPAKVLKLLGDRSVGFIDTRTEKEFTIAHLPGAKNIPLESLSVALTSLSKDIEWVVYDKTAENAKDVVRQMTEKGFKTRELSGGIQVWAAKKYPLETGPAK